VTDPDPDREPEASGKRWLLWLIVGGPFLIYALGKLMSR
jgi:hypothetical protein